MIRRRTEYLLREAKRRGHILEGQLIAISSLDEVIRICRSSPSRAEAKERLQDLEVVGRACWSGRWATSTSPPCSARSACRPSYRMTEAQAEAVVRMQLGQLAALERDEIFKEYNELREQDPRLRGRCCRATRNILDVIRRPTWTRCATSTATSAGPRSSTTRRPASTMEDLIAEETQRRHAQPQRLHQAAAAEHLPQPAPRRQGRLRRQTREDDFIEHFFVASTHAYLLCFTNRGQLYWLKVYDIPQMSRTSAGPGDRQRAVAARRRRRSPASSRCATSRRTRYLMMATRRGHGQEDRRWRSTAGPRRAASSASAWTRATR